MKEREREREKNDNKNKKRMSKQLAAIYTFLPGAFVLRERKREKSKELFFGERGQKIENGLDSTQETDVIFFSGLGKCRKLNGFFFFFFSQCMFLFPCYIADRVSMHLHWLNTHTHRADSRYSLHVCKRVDKVARTGKKVVTVTQQLG